MRIVDAERIVAAQINFKATKGVVDFQDWDFSRNQLHVGRKKASAMLPVTKKWLWNEKNNFTSLRDNIPNSLRKRISKHFVPKDI